MAGEPWRLDWSHGTAWVEPVGAMLAPVEFKLEDGRTVQPFSLFPWHDEPVADGERPLSGLVARGRGDWNCLPFGLARPRDQLVEQWREYHADGSDGPAHGACAHTAWELVDRGADWIELLFRGAAGSPIRTMRRRIRAVSGRAAIRCELSVDVSSRCRMPIGVHPTVRLPMTPGALELRPGRFRFGRTFPGRYEHGFGVFAIDRSFSRLAAVPGRDGGPIDARRLPFRTLCRRRCSIVWDRRPIRAAES